LCTGNGRGSWRYSVASNAREEELSRCIENLSMGFSAAMRGSHIFKCSNEVDNLTVKMNCIGVKSASLQVN
jgi:hypothetical protein